MRNILKIKFGSHLYGTDTPQSDFDFKEIFIPSPEDIIRGTTVDAFNSSRPKAEGEKNFAGENDTESYSLKKFMNLICQGQTVSLDVLFAPDWALLEPLTEEWKIIRANKHRLLTRKSLAFVGYCRAQANKYGIKGSRVASARKALSILDNAVLSINCNASTVKLSRIENTIHEVVSCDEHMSIDTIVQAGGVPIKYWNVCGRKLQYSASMLHARDVMKSLVDEYGHRALKAEKNEGVDWKALSHAVRIGRQALELMTTANITFPLTYRDHIIAIKSGSLDYKVVSAEIENLLEEIEATSEKSILPHETDKEWVDDFVFNVYKDEIRNYLRDNP